MLVFDYDKAMAQVRELRSIAGEMQKSQALANAAQSANASWQGRTSDMFQATCRQLEEMVAKEADNIGKVADSLERSAYLIDAAERAAAASKAAFGHTSKR